MNTIIRQPRTDCKCALELKINEICFFFPDSVLKRYKN